LNHRESNFLFLNDDYNDNPLFLQQRSNMNHQQNSTSTLTGFNSALFDEASFMRFLDQTTKSHHDEDSYMEPYKGKSISGTGK